MKRLLLAAASLALVATGAAAQTPKKGGILNFAINSEPPTLDCHATTTFATIHPIRPIYSGLLQFRGDVNKKLEIVGDLAKSWTMSADGKTFTFKLHDNVKFHDGTALTSTDVKVSYERIIKPPQGIVSPRSALHTDIDGIDTPDASTVVFNLKQANASMINNFASPFNCIYSAAKLTENQKYMETAPMGSGAFQFVEYVKGATFAAKKFDGYFKAGLPHLDGYKTFIVKGPAIVPGIQGGQFDVEFRGRTPKEHEQLVQAMGNRVVSQSGPWTTTLLFTYNTKKKPFDDIRVRQALTMAIDRWGSSDGLSKVSFMRYVGGMSRPGSEFALPDSELEKLPGYSRNIAKAREDAKKLLADAGATGLKFRLVNRNIGEPYTTAGIFLIAEWKKLGLDVEHALLENKAYFEAQSAGQFDVMVEFIADFVDDPTLQHVKFVSSDKSPVSFAGHTDRKLDDLFEKQLRAVDPAERRKLVHEFERHTITQANSAMLHWWQRIVTYNAKIKGWELHAAHFTGQDLTEVWLDR